MNDDVHGDDDDADNNDADNIHARNDNAENNDADFVQGVDLRGCFFSLQAWLAGCHIHTSKVS